MKELLLVVVLGSLTLACGDLMPVSPSAVHAIPSPAVATDDASSWAGHRPVPAPEPGPNGGPLPREPKPEPNQPPAPGPNEPGPNE